MNYNAGSGKVINLTEKLAGKRTLTDHDKNLNSKSDKRIIAVTSGKGGVGKTNIVANLGYALGRLNKKVLILDADLGLGNLDVLLGLAPKYNLSHVIKGTKNIQEIIINYHGKMKILPASSGIQEISQLTKKQKSRILSELDSLIDTVDIMLIDTAAGISSNVMYFNASAHEIMVVVSPEPTSITDAYALMKILSLKYSEKHFKLLVNMAKNDAEANEVARQLRLVANRFLDISIEYIGCILYDKNVTKSVRHQKIIAEIFPDSTVNKYFDLLAKNICRSPVADLSADGSNVFWKHLFKKKFE